MANNRLFLVYEPTGMAVYLGKRMGLGWYDAPSDAGMTLQALYDHVREAGLDQDAFRVVTEDEFDIYGTSTPDGLIQLGGFRSREHRNSAI